MTVCLSVLLQENLEMTVTHNNYSDNLFFENITILGVRAPAASVKVSHSEMGVTELSSSHYSYDPDKKVK